MTSKSAADETTWFGSRRSDQPTFYFLNPSRLVGRLIHFFHGLRFSKQVDGKFVTIWLAPNMHSARFDDPPSYLLHNIFDLEKYRDELGDDLVVCHGSQFPRERWPNLDGPEFAHMRPSNYDRSFFGGGVEAYSVRYGSFQFSDEKKSSGQLLSEANALFRAMPHTVAVQEALKEAMDRLGTDSFTAIHVRRSDVGVVTQKALESFSRGEMTPEKFRFIVNNFVVRVAPPEAYFPEIAAAIAAKRKIVFTGDVPNAISPFEKQFGAEHFVDLATLVKAEFPIQKAFCDFWILTKADKVVSTGSMFARQATNLGNSKLINVILSASVEEVERFAIDVLAPQLAGDRQLRDAFLLEIAQSYEDRKVDRGGRLNNINSWLPAIRASANGGDWKQAMDGIDRAVEKFGLDATPALTDLRIRALFNTGRLDDAEQALVALGGRDLEKALSIICQFAAKTEDPTALLRFMRQLHLKHDLTKDLANRNIRFLVNAIERQLSAKKMSDSSGLAVSDLFGKIRNLIRQLSKTA